MKYSASTYIRDAESMSRDVRAARTGVLSKYRKEFPICTFSLAKNIENVNPSKIKIGELTKYEQFLGVKCDSNLV